MRPLLPEAWRRHGVAPLHLRLLALSALCLLALWGLFVLLWRMGPSAEDRQDMERSVHNHVVYLAQDLGPQPSQAKAAKLAAECNWQFRWQGKDGSTWTTDPELPSFQVFEKDLRPGKDSGWHEGHYFSLRDLPTGRLALAFRPWKPPQVAGLRLLFFVGCILGILALSTLAARHMLRPLRDLDSALVSLAEGDLSARLPESPLEDELGRLTRRFNQTAAEVGRMLQSRRQLLLDVSHELRTPLTRLNLGLEMLPDPAARASLKEDVAEMEAMVAELLEGARLEEAARWKPKALGLDRLMQTALQAQAGRQPGVEWGAPPPAVTVAGDERGLSILLRNLLDNALKYSGQQSRPVELRLEAAAGEALLSVRDHGPGIAAVALPHVFEPFYRADAARTRGAGGFGLGLHLVKRIANAHGGDVRVENNADGGARFIVRLPLAPGALS